MPKRLERHLKESAKRAGLEPGTERYDAYVYGTMNRIEKERGERTDDGDHDRKD